jgi:hypothetical protein
VTQPWREGPNPHRRRLHRKWRDWGRPDENWGRRGRWSPGLDREGSDRENEIVPTKPCRVSDFRQRKTRGGEHPLKRAASHELSSRFDGAKEEKESARDRGKRDGIERAEESETGKEVLQNGFKAGWGDANGPARKQRGGI